MTLPNLQVATIIMDNNSVLLVRKSGDKWSIPSGQPSAYEEIKTTSLRNIFELTGITSNPEHVMFVSEEVNEKTDTHTVYLYVFAKYVSGTLSKAEWLDDAQWIDVRQLGALQENMTDQTIDALFKFSKVLQQSAARSGAQA